ncbi:hypothetical protein SY86_00945 [Erwinia tracheiphila]|uniref:Uncharacterized protein n=1 Tax=Erwinia tracheiphila TaxID=65700 RepID=A0A0M2KGM2_9GAMM|nr:hypothetical protein [Erwinia tracheiphila]AXF75240.1 hypothetical protein AV903_02560 [Erwinia tracheiphila]KKF38114.1 hypothetical protein SY86_00945 [Erwinia tracheiphila]
MLGEMALEKGTLQVNSLLRLLNKVVGYDGQFLGQLYQQGYYATLSDYFRLLILIEYGACTWMQITCITNR